MSKQVDKEHYEFERYSHPARFVSYFYQLKEVLNLGPKRILEVGVGDKVFGEYIKNNTNIDYKSVDVAEDLSPDVVGSVLALPFNNGEFDIICAFEVLEHLPFDKFENALSEMKRVSSKYIAFSVPHFGPPIKFLLKIPFLPEIKFAFKISFHKKHEFDGEHYWEIGKSGFPISKIKNILEKNFKILKDFVPFDNQYHHFFILEKKD